ncbi:MAG: MATE family efflux transporter [Alphaproteobacteria bacterium]
MQNTIKNLSKLIFPVVALQLIEFSSAFIDSIMIGQYDPISFGGVSLAGVFYYTFFAFFLGVMMMIGPLIGQANGANNKRLIARNVRSGVWIGILFVIIFGIILYNIDAICKAFNFSTELTYQVTEFIDGKKYSILIFIAVPFRYFLINQGIFKHILTLSIMTLPMNILFNWMFIYGKFGVPEMGIYGAGLATSLSVIINSLLLITIATLKAKQQEINLWVRFWKIDFEIFKKILILGIPTGIAITLEMVIFSISNVYVGQFDKYSISAFALTIQIWNLLYGTILGIAEGTSIYTANQAGKKDRTEIIKAIKIGFGFLLILNTVVALIIFNFSNNIFALMLDSSADSYIQIVNLVNPIVYLFMIAFLVESISQIPTKFLQSINDTKYIPIIQLIGYGIIGPLLGYVLCFIYDYKLDGIYISIIIGIFISAFTMNMRAYYSIHKDRIFKKVETK